MLGGYRNTKTSLAAWALAQAAPHTTMFAVAEQRCNRHGMLVILHVCCIDKTSRCDVDILLSTVILHWCNFVNLFKHVIGLTV